MPAEGMKARDESRVSEIDERPEAILRDRDSPAVDEHFLLVRPGYAGWRGDRRRRHPGQLSPVDLRQAGPPGAVGLVYLRVAG